MAGLGYPHVELGMYPFASVAWAWDEIWAAVHERARWTPELLTRSGDVGARWSDAHCLVTHVCAGPFAARHHTDMHLVGAFSLDIPEADGASYRSVLLSPHAASLEVLVAAGGRAVANSTDSLSGWISLLAATVGAGGAWPGEVSFTSAHVDSVRALAAREADLGSIDAWSLALIEADEPDLVAGLHRVGLGPLVPTPAITARRSVDPDSVDELRDAFEDALRDDATREARAALRVAGFAQVTLDAYDATRALGR